MKRKLFYLFALGICLLTASCNSTKRFAYLQDMKPGEAYPFDNKHEAVILCNDRLDITVSSKSPELAIPFNVNGGTFQVGQDGNVTSSIGNTSNKGYRVDSEGYIDFPILGRLNVEGMTIDEAKNMIKERIIMGKYIKDPIVSIEFLNFRYTVLGAVANNGIFTLEGDRITLLEAIAKAGDLSSKARLNRVKVIREEGGERKMYVHDLRSKNLFLSPCYYLQQNDIVYVEPRFRKQDGEDKTLKYITLITSIASTTASIIWITDK